MDVVILGATGFIGRHLVNDISGQKGVKLRLLIHKSSPDTFVDKPNITVIRGDLLDPETLDGLFSENAIVVNLAYLNNGSRKDNLTAIDNLLAACVKAKIRRLIHSSSTSVFGSVSDDIVTENTKCNPVNDYQTTKMQIENKIFCKTQDVFEAAILRPTAIFGPGGKNLLKLARDLKFGNKAANYMKKCLYNTRRMNLVSVHSIVAALKLLIDTDRKINREVFIISDDESESNNYSYVEGYLVNKLGLSDYGLPIIPTPHFVLKILLRMKHGMKINPGCAYNCQKLLDLGLKKNVSFEDALAEFADWLQKSGI